MPLLLNNPVCEVLYSFGSSRILKAIAYDIKFFYPIMFLDVHHFGEDIIYTFAPPTTGFPLFICVGVAPIERTLAETTVSIAAS